MVRAGLWFSSGNLALLAEGPLWLQFLASPTPQLCKLWGEKSQNLTPSFLYVPLKSHTTVQVYLCGFVLVWLGTLPAVFRAPSWLCTWGSLLAMLRAHSRQGSEDSASTVATMIQTMLSQCEMPGKSFPKFLCCWWDPSFLRLNVIF